MASATSVFSRQPTKEKGGLQSELLKNFAARNGTAFPVVATLVGCDDAETVLDKFNVRYGTELVVHGWTRQSKVLAVGTTPTDTLPFLTPMSGSSDLVRFGSITSVTFTFFPPGSTSCESPTSVASPFRYVLATSSPSSRRPSRPSQAFRQQRLTSAVISCAR